jgi:hypothetical protein
MGEIPQTFTFPTCSLNFPFFKTRTTNTHNHKKQPHPLATPKMASEGEQGAARPGRVGRGPGRRKTESIAESVLLTPAGAGRGPPGPTGLPGHPPAWQAPGGHRAGLSGRGRKSSKPWFTSCSIHVGTRRGQGVDTMPTGPGQEGEWYPPQAGRWDSCNSKNGVGGGVPGRKLAEMGAQQTLSSAPSTQPGLIGFFVYINFFFFF